jgi:hypothetical protein
MTPPAAKHIRLRWPGRCAACERELAKGVWAWHDATSRSVRCEPCVDTAHDAEPDVSPTIPSDLPATVEQLDYGNRCAWKAEGRLDRCFSSDATAGPEARAPAP